MKQRLSPATQQHLVLTPQLRQAIRLLQLSAAELEAEVAEAVASNPLLDWQDDGALVDPPVTAGAVSASPEPASGDIEPAKPLLTPAKVEPGKKRVVKKPSRVLSFSYAKMSAPPICAAVVPLPASAFW